LVGQDIYEWDTLKVIGMEIMFLGSKFNGDISYQITQQWKECFPYQYSILDISQMEHIKNNHYEKMFDWLNSIKIFPNGTYQMLPT